MATEIQSKNEVTLFNVRYRIDGRVTEQSLPVFAPKQLFGDPTRQDQVSVGQWIMNDWRDGMGVYDYAESDSVATFYESGAETRIKGRLGLPRTVGLSTQISVGGGGELSEAAAMLTWGTTDYVCRKTTVF